MSDKEFHQAHFDHLMQRMCDEQLTDSERAELLQLLNSSKAARRRYVQFVHLSISLADWSLSVIARVEPSARADEPQLNPYPHFAADSVRLSTRAAPVADREQAVRRRLDRASMGIAAAAAVLLAVVVGAISGSFDARPEQTLNRSVHKPPITLVNNPVYVARVVEVTPDVQWDVEARPDEFLMRLRAGDQLHLKQGLAKVEFYSGATLILHGPVRFEPTGLTSAYLHAGSVSGQVEDTDFLLATPTAQVVDLGTEFGVSVGPLTDTDVLVFDGKVNVRSEVSNPELVQESISLTEGMTVRVGEDGRIGGASTVRADCFSRRFSELAAPSENGTELSLVDIMCGGSGKGQRLAAAIDPLTGDLDRLGWQKPGSPGTRRGNQDFHNSADRLLIDGAFIPASGRPQQVDSLGSKVSLPISHGAYTWGPVWARRYTNDLAVLPHRDENDFWGADTFPAITERLEDSLYGGIGIHASVGITFDLQDVRNLHAAEIESFQAVLTNLDNAEAHNPEYAKANERSANFFVIIDGEIRYQQLHFRRNVKGLDFEVPIAAADRMLTLVSTDDNNSNKYDHIVLIDPVLKLQGAPQVYHDRNADSLLSAFEL